MDARFESRVEAAAEWLMSDDSAYEHDRDAALHTAREMLTIGDQVEARFEAASQRAIKILETHEKRLDKVSALLEEVFWGTDISGSYAAYKIVDCWLKDPANRATMKELLELWEEPEVPPAAGG